MLEKTSYMAFGTRRGTGGLVAKREVTPTADAGKWRQQLVARSERGEFLWHCGNLTRLFTLHRKQR